MNTFINNVQDKKRTRDLFKSVAVLRLAQIKSIEQLSQPLKDNRNMVLEVLKGTASIEQYLHHSKQVEMHLMKLKKVLG